MYNRVAHCPQCRHKCRNEVERRTQEECCHYYWEIKEHFGCYVLPVSAFDIRCYAYHLENPFIGIAHYYK